MLVLTRNKKQSIDIIFDGKTMRVTVLKTQGQRVHLGFEGTKDIVVVRTELLQKVE